jgi:hypothetical protein
MAGLIRVRIFIRWTSCKGILIRTLMLTGAETFGAGHVFFLWGQSAMPRTTKVHYSAGIFARATAPPLQPKSIYPTMNSNCKGVIAMTSDRQTQVLPEVGRTKVAQPQVLPPVSRTLESPSEKNLAQPQTRLQEVLPELNKLAQKVGGMEQLSQIIETLKAPQE